jgi:hypothetical protein
MGLKTDIAVFSRMRGNKILERLTVQDFNTPHSCDYRYKISRLTDTPLIKKTGKQNLISIFNSITTNCLEKGILFCYFQNLNP